MKPVDKYLKSAVITILPNPLKHLNTLRIEINPTECVKEGYADMFYKLLVSFRRNWRFSVTTDINNTFNYTGQQNVMEFMLPVYANEAEIARDIAEELEKEDLFGKDSVLNRVTIKKELRK